MDVTSPDATAARSLECRAECTCERHEQRDFMLCGTLVTFDEAAARCTAARGALVSVPDAALGAWLTERMQALAQDDFWLSGSDAQEEGVWRWADGSVFFDVAADAAAPGYAPWDDEQPNDLNGEDCMRSVGGVWRDLGCAEELAYACEG